jgi:hypothetical protein
MVFDKSPQESPETAKWQLFEDFPMQTQLAHGFFCARNYHDFDDLALAMRGWNHCFRQLSRGAFRGTMRVLKTSCLEIHEISVNQVIQGRGKPPAKGFIVMPVTATNAGAVWRGHRLQPGALSLIRPDQEHDHLSCRGEVLISVNIASATGREDGIALDASPG